MLLGISNSVSADGMGPYGEQYLDGLSFSLFSIFGPCLSLGQEYFWVKNLEMGGWTHPSTGGAYLLKVVSSRPISHLLGILANVIYIRSWESLASLVSGNF